MWLVRCIVPFSHGDKLVYCLLCSGGTVCNVGSCSSLGQLWNGGSENLHELLKAVLDIAPMHQALKQYLFQQV